MTSRHITATIWQTAGQLAKQFSDLQTIDGSTLPEPLADAVEVAGRAIGCLVVESALARRPAVNAAYKCGRRLARHGQPLDNTADRADMAGDELLAMQAGHVEGLARLQRKGGAQ